MTFLMMESVEEEACDVICIMKRLFFIITTFSFTVDGFVNFLVNSMKINFWSIFSVGKSGIFEFQIDETVACDHAERF